MVRYLLSDMVDFGILKRSDMATSQSPGYPWLKRPPSLPPPLVAAVPGMAGTIDIWH